MNDTNGAPSTWEDVEPAKALAVVDQQTWIKVQEQMVEAGYLGEAEMFDRCRRIGVQASAERGEEGTSNEVGETFE